MWRLDEIIISIFSIVLIFEATSVKSETPYNVGDGIYQINTLNINNGQYFLKSMNIELTFNQRIKYENINAISDAKPRNNIQLKCGEFYITHKHNPFYFCNNKGNGYTREQNTTRNSTHHHHHNHHQQLFNNHHALLNVLNNDYWPCDSIKRHQNHRHNHLNHLKKTSTIGGKVYFENNQLYPRNITSLILKNKIKCHILINSQDNREILQKKRINITSNFLGNYNNEPIRANTYIDLIPVTPSCDTTHINMLLLLKQNDNANRKHSHFISSLQKSIDLKIEERNNISRSELSSFLSVKEMGEEIIGMEPTIEYVLHWILKPLVATVLKMLDTDDMAALNEDLAHGVNEQIPGDTSSMLSETVDENITGPVTDNVVQSVQEFMEQTLPKHIAGYVGKHVPQAIIPRLHTPISNIITEIIPHRLTRGAPMLVARSLYITLTQALTRSVVHVLVPSISKTATANKAQTFFCKMCFSSGKYCTKCHDSPQSSYYNSYYSTYYSDWYADYYANYYTDALENIDTVHHPLGHRSSSATPIGMAAQGWNEGEIKKLRKETMEALGAANKGPVVPQMGNLAAAVDGTSPNGKDPWWKKILEFVVEKAKALVTEKITSLLPGGKGVEADGAKEAVQATVGKLVGDIGDMSLRL